jgi:glycosyltransferase 2 family protein
VSRSTASIVPATAAPTHANRGVRATAAIDRRRAHVYSSPPGQPRSRHASDVVLLVSALVGLVLLIVAYPPSNFEQSLVDFLASVPGWLDPVWGFLYDLLWLWAIVLVVLAVIFWRPVVALQGLGSVVLAVLVAVLAARIAVGSWPDVGDLIRGGSGAPPFPSARIAEAGAVIVTVAPHLVAPLRSAGRWILLLGTVGALLASGTTPGGIIAGLLIALVAAAGIRVAFGTSAGRLGVSDVAASLRELGVSADGLEIVERQIAGVFIVRGRDSEGSPLLVKVYGRDAHDNQLAIKFWRTLWYRDGGPALQLSRGQAAEHEAFVALLARNAGIPTREVVTAGKTTSDDALLVLRGAARPLESLRADEIDDEVLRRSWRTLDLLGGAGIAHLRIDPSTLVVVDDAVGLVDFDGATVAPSADQLQTDRAQLLVATASLAGRERGLQAAAEALGTAGLEALLPYLQPAALGGQLRKAIKASAIDLDEFRAQAAKVSGVEAPELARLRRVTRRSLIQAALLVLVATAILDAVTNVDWAEVGSSLENASWEWLAFAFVVAQTPRLTQAVATLGSVAARLPFGPVYTMQLATGYMNLALPSSVARMTVNTRFFQRQGLAGAAAITSGVIDSLAGNVVQAVLLVMLLIFSESTLSLQLSTPSGGSLTLLWILVGLLVAVVLVVVLVGRVRRAVVARVRQWWPEVRTALGALRRSNKLALLVGGNIATEVLFATALGLCALGLGYHIPLNDLLVINLSVALFSSFIPVPGGIGVTEFGLTVGLTSAGMPSASALAAVIVYRLSTFYIPPVWGYFAMRWLERNRYL